MSQRVHPPAPTSTPAPPGTVETGELPWLSVVVPTRDRGERVRIAVESVLANAYPKFDLTVIDQSRDDTTQKALTALMEDPRMEYLASDSVGISAARNLGASRAQGSIVVHTDDDCEVPAEWLSSISAFFTSNSGVDLVFGNVEAGQHPPSGFIPSYRVAAPLIVEGLRSKHRVEGIGACMAYRRGLWDRLSGFDEALGVGSSLGSAEEVDFSIRALAAGHEIAESPSIGVVHHGFHGWKDGESLIERHLYGIGAVSAKNLRRSGTAFFPVLCRLAMRWAFGTTVVDFGRRPARSPRLRAFVRGFRKGFSLPIDGRGHFRIK